MLRARPSGSGRSRPFAGGGECGSIIPRFPAPSLTTREFRWLAPEAWNDDHKARYLRLRQAAAVGLYAPTPFVHARRRVPPVAVGPWLLEAGEAASPSTPVAPALVEAEVFITSFTSVHALVSPCEPRALSLMLSGLMIVTQADIVRVIPLDPAFGKTLVALGWGPAVPLWTPVAAGDGPRGITVETLRLDPHEWWTRPPGEGDRRTLAYLEKRLKLEAEKAKPPRRPRAGFSQLISRLLRWS